MDSAVGDLHLVTEEFRALAEAVRHHVLHPFFKALAVVRGDAVPMLGCAIVQVIDAVQVHVL